MLSSNRWIAFPRIHLRRPQCRRAAHESPEHSPNRQERSMIEKTSNEHHLHVSLHDITPEHAAGAGVIKPGYAPRLTNEDLAPLRNQTWKSYNFFAFWMSDVHSVGGYVTAGSLFALGLAAWQVLIALLVGITIVYFLCNLVARPSQATGAPYAETAQYGFAGLSLLGWIGFGIMWIAQAIVFWRGMESIRKFIDFCGP